MQLTEAQALAFETANATAAEIAAATTVEKERDLLILLAPRSSPAEAISDDINRDVKSVLTLGSTQTTTFAEILKSAHRPRSSDRPGHSVGPSDPVPRRDPLQTPSDIESATLSPDNTRLAAASTTPPRGPVRIVEDVGDRIRTGSRTMTIPRLRSAGARPSEHAWGTYRAGMSTGD